MLSQEELQRYARHLVLPGVREQGQEKLKSASVLIVGAGGLGTPAAMYLAAAGIGTLGIADDDVVELSNLHRQPLHNTDSVGKRKVDSAQERLHAINPHVRAKTYTERLNSKNALGVLSEYDIIVDASDNYPTRYLLSDACTLLKKLIVHGSVLGFEGRVYVFNDPAGPCYRCAYPEPPPPELTQDCSEAGVLGVLPGIIGTIQAAEVVKLILGIGQPLVGRVLLLNGLSMEFRELRLNKNPDCPACGTTPTVTALIDYEQFCGMKKEMKRNGSISVVELKQALDGGKRIFILDVREPEEYRIANLGGYLIPLQDLPERMKELDPEQDIVVHCHHGNRSAFAVQFLEKAGFSSVRNLEGGIDEWARTIDSRLQRY